VEELSSVAAPAALRDNTCMHLTTEEVALASAAVGGLIALLGGTARDRSTERRDHLKRLWEKEIEIYESVLLESNARKYTHRRYRFVLESEEEAAEAVLKTNSKKLFGIDDLDEIHLPTRLTMFADRKFNTPTMNVCASISGRFNIC
jgi:hypothetical protein